MKLVLDHFNTQKQLEAKGFEFVGDFETHNPVGNIRRTYPVYEKDGKQYACRHIGTYSDGQHVEMKPAYRMNLQPKTF